MDLNSNKASPVISDPAPINKPRLGISSNSNLRSCSKPGASYSPEKYMALPRVKLVKVDDVRSNGWLDAMKSSSPPRKKLIKDLNVEVASDDIDLAYSSWMVFSLCLFL